jgi:protein involved in polysaccharide export with SLBB domain
VQGAIAASSSGQSAIEGAAAALGLTSEQVDKLKSELASGTLGPDEVQQLCVRLAAKHIRPEDIDSIARSLNLSLTSEQLQQLKSCTRFTFASPPGSEPSPVPETTNVVTEQPTTENLSSVEKAFQRLDSDLPPEEPASTKLTQYGYSLFATKVSTFAPVNDIPVSANYVVGPGDELKLLMWGRINQSFDLEVARDGTVAIPEIGPLQVAGLTFAQVKHLIEARAGQITGVQVEVTMGQLRSIQVFVIGEVNQPGPYTVSSLSHVSNALVACGGITKIGSLRKVQLRRGNQLIRVIDLYDVLMRGNTAADEQLEPNDVIFVPVIGSVVGVAGDVKRPAIYELSGSSLRLEKVIGLAGGISAFGYSRRIQVERIESHQRRSVLDIDLSELRSEKFEVLDGDLVKVYPVLPRMNGIVTVKGNVNRPGIYQWHGGIRIADLIHESEGLAPGTFMRYAMVQRAQADKGGNHVIPVNLGEALSDHLSGPQNISLHPGDTLTILNVNQIRDLPTVQVFGEVRNPGFYTLTEGMRVSDLVYIAGGLRDDAFLAQAELARTQVLNGSNTHHVYMDLDLRGALAGARDDNLELKPNDQVFVRRAPGWHLPWVVDIKGEVLRPGYYTIRQNERLASVLARAGGILPDAYLPGTVFIRRSVEELEQKRIDEMRTRLQHEIAELQLRPVSAGENEQSRSSRALMYLQQVLDQSQNQQATGRMVVHLLPLQQLALSQDDVLLEDQDRITIPKRPSAVNVLGEVYHPTAIVYEPALTVGDYLQRAGGPAEGADADHTFVVKADGSIVTDEAVRNGGRGRIFPLLPVISGGLMDQHLEPGDTVYVPQKLIYTSDLEYTKDVTQIVASSAQALAVIALLALHP